MTVPAALPVINIDERRARLAVRHRLVPGLRAADAVDAARSLVALHATDPGTVYLSVWARVDGFAVPDLEAALYTDRSLVKHLAMRRTLWVLPRDVLPYAQAGASERVAVIERRNLIKEVEAAGLHRNGARWLDRAGRQVLGALADGRELTSSELRAELSVLEGSIAYGEGKTWGGTVPIGPRVLTVLSAEGRVMRASNDGGWAVSRPRWTSTESWLGAALPTMSGEEGLAGMVERWLRAFGPGTVADIKWWLKSTVAAVRQALAEIGAVEVALDDGAVGYVLADDLEPVGPVEPWVALLPPLDPTTMGWTERGWYLGEHKAQLFDTAGNAGPTVWCDGRIVGGWRQRDDGSVELQLLEKVGRAQTKALTARADELTEWFDGKRVLMRFPSPLSKATAT
jgi:hypothetical protein